MARNRLLVLPAFAVIATMTLTGCGADAKASDTFTAKITLTSSTPLSLGFTEGGECEGMGNDSMQEGKPWKIQAEGETIAMGELPAGVGVKNGSGPVDCHFEFTAEIPSGYGFYTIDMGKRQGVIEVSEEKLAEGVVYDRQDLEGDN